MEIFKFKLQNPFVNPSMCNCEFGAQSNSILQCYQHTFKICNACFRCKGVSPSCRNDHRYLKSLIYKTATLIAAPRVTFLQKVLYLQNYIDSTQIVTLGFSCFAFIIIIVHVNNNNSVLWNEHDVGRLYLLFSLKLFHQAIVCFATWTEVPPLQFRKHLQLCCYFLFYFVSVLGPSCPSMCINGEG